MINLRNKWRDVCNHLSSEQQINFLIDALILSKYNPNRYALYYSGVLMTILFVTFTLSTFVRVVTLFAWFFTLIFQLIIYMDMLIKFKRKWK